MNRAVLQRTLGGLVSQVSVLRYKNLYNRKSAPGSKVLRRIFCVHIIRGLHYSLVVDFFRKYRNVQREIPEEAVRNTRRI